MTKELNQKCAETYYNRGLAHSKKGAFELAIEDFDKAIELNPNFAEAHYQRGIAYRIKGDYKLAITDYTKAIEKQKCVGVIISTKINSHSGSDSCLKMRPCCLSLLISSPAMPRSVSLTLSSSLGEWPSR